MKLSKEPPQGYIEHIRRTALSAAQGVGIEAGARITRRGAKAVAWQTGCCYQMDCNGKEKE